MLFMLHFIFQLWPIHCQGILDHFKNPLTLIIIMIMMSAQSHKHKCTDPADPNIGAAIHDLQG